jgi:hypothetical protein
MDMNRIRYWCSAVCGCRAESDDAMELGTPNLSGGAVGIEGPAEAPASYGEPASKSTPTSLVPKVKQEIYSADIVKKGPNRGLHRTSGSFNGKVTYLSGQNKDSFIECQDLAYLYLIESAGAIDSIFQNEQHIQARFDKMDLKDYNIRAKIISLLDRKSRLLISNDNFGKYLSDIIDAIKNSALNESNLLLSTRGHVMAAKITWKAEDDKEERVSLRFYNPDETGKITKIELPTSKKDFADNLKDLRLTSCFPSWRNYYPAGVDESEAWVSSVPLEDMDFNFHSEMAYMSLDKLGLQERCAAAIVSNMPSLVNDWSDEAVHSKRKREALRCLFEDNYNGLCAFTRAVIVQNTELIQPLINSLKKLDASPRLIIKALNGTLPDSVPLLNEAARAGLADIVMAFGVAVSELKIPLHEILSFLESKRPDGVTALCMAADNDRGTILTANANILKNLNRSNDQSLQFLENKSFEMPPLYIAAASGNIQFLEAYYDVFKILETSSAQSTKHLIATGPDGLSAREIAVKNGKVNFVEAYDRLTAWALSLT